MSVKALSWAWEQELPEGEKLLLMAIADHADDEGNCWPGQQGLARKIGRTDRTVRTRLVKLEALGLIARRPRYNSEGHRISDMITLLIPTGKLCHRKTLLPGNRQGYYLLHLVALLLGIVLLSKVGILRRGMATDRRPRR